MASTHTGAICVPASARPRPSTRWDALTLVRAYKISATLPALRQLEAQLERSDDPGAPYEAAKVNRVIGFLGDELDCAE